MRRFDPLRALMHEALSQSTTIQRRQLGVRIGIAVGWLIMWSNLEGWPRYAAMLILFVAGFTVAIRMDPEMRAERDLRMSKVKQKVSGCFRKAEFAQAYCRISSYLQTMANQGYNPLVAIQMALSGQLYTKTG